MQLKNKISLNSLFLIVGIFTLLLGFQNCSPVTVKAIGADTKVEASSLPTQTTVEASSLPAQTTVEVSSLPAQTTVEASSLPAQTTVEVSSLPTQTSKIVLTPGEQSLPLKLYFIVDDSHTMSQSQNNLTLGIDKMVTGLKGITADILRTTTSISRSDTYDYFSMNGDPLTSIQNLEVGTKFKQFSDSRGNSAKQQVAKLEAKSTTSQFNAQVSRLKEILKPGTNGWDNEEGLAELATEISRRDKSSFFKKGDKAMLVLISDEDDFSSNLINRYRFDNYEIINHTRPDQDQWAAYYKVWTVDIKFKHTTSIDGISTGVSGNRTGRVFVHPSVLFPTFDSTTAQNGSPCGATDTVLKEKIREANTIAATDEIVEVTSCSLLHQETWENGSEGFKAGEGEKWFAAGTTVTDCAGYFGWPNFGPSDYPDPHVLGSGTFSKSRFLIESCHVTFLQNLPGLIYKGQKFLSNISSDTLMDEFKRKNPSLPPFLTTSTSSYLAKDFLNLGIKMKLEEMFGVDGYNIALIVNDSSCALNPGQSVGSRYIDLKQKLGERAKIIPICSPDKWADALNTSALEIKSQVIRTLNLPINFSQIVGVKVLRGSQSLPLETTKYRVLNGNLLELNDGILIPGDRVEVEFIGSL